MPIEIDYVREELSNQNNRKDKSKVRYFKYKKLRYFKQECKSKQKEEQMQVRVTIFNSKDIGSIDIRDDISYESRSDPEDNDKLENSKKLCDDETFREMTQMNKDFIYHREYRCKVENCQQCNSDSDKELI